MALDRNIKHLQPELYKRVRMWLNDCRYEGIEPFIVEGLRSYTRQKELYAQGRTKNGPKVTNAKAGQSYHNFGLAIDCVPYLSGTHTPDFDFDPKSPEWKRVVLLAKGRGLNYGGDWKTFKDFPHFEAKGAPALWVCRLMWPGGWKTKEK